MIAYAVVSKRPPLLGYNHNVRHAGRLFHVQTEDSGLVRLYVTTHLFFEGTILSTSRLQYTADEADEAVQKKMQVQHKTMLKRLRDGDFDLSQDSTARNQLAKSTTDSGAFAVPHELVEEPGQATLKMAMPAVKEPAPAAPPASAASEIDVSQAPTGPRAIVRDPARESADAAQKTAGVATGPILAPVAPPPVLPRPSAAGTLAERLRRPGTPGGSGPPPPPIPGTRPAVTARPAPLTTAPVPPPRLAESPSVLEFEADLPDDEDDLEPAVTIEVAEPTAAPAPPEPTLSYGASALPGRLPTPGPLAGQSLSQTGAPRVPVAMAAAATQPIAPPSPVLAARPLASTVLRTKPTAEGVVLQRTLVPTPSVRPGSDALRTTSPRARPTAPAPLAVAQPMHPPEDDRSLDPVVLAYLAREVRPRES